ncbi:Aspartate carbamoyltransferase [hydrothermal vent metagenome]|uniref:Aspartate carbamoyltransferase n=1 Tax=hydrothermal vent metagenome TaxID=652676 RepID=A0A3B1DLD6_9ZZZZ
MNLYDYERRLNRPMRMKNVEFNREGRLKHVIFSQQFDPQRLSKLFSYADKIRTLAHDKKGCDQLRSLLSHKRAMLYFTQPSTRTFLSFMAACQILGITCNEVRDPKVSSEVKRESPIDSVRMFSSYFDVIIMRSIRANLAETCAYLMNDLEGFNQRNVPIVNAGSGKDQHPTQALLDLYTIHRTFQFDHSEEIEHSRLTDLKQEFPELEIGIDNKIYAFCGDIGRGRTVRSLAYLLSQYKNSTMYFIAPDHSTLRMGDDLRDDLHAANVTVKEVDSLDGTIEGKPLLSQIDCLYMTRIQQEHDSAEEKTAFDEIDFSNYHLTPERVSRMKCYAPILHPFPRDSQAQEIPVEIDADPRAMYFRQARNGMWIRAALLVHLFDAVEDLLAIYEDSFPFESTT